MVETAGRTTAADPLLLGDSGGRQRRRRVVKDRKRGCCLPPPTARQPAKMPKAWPPLLHRPFASLLSFQQAACSSVAKKKTQPCASAPPGAKMT